MPLVSFIILSYNEGKIIKRSAKKITAAFKKLGCKYEIIIASDGSRDSTYRIAAKLSRDPRIRQLYSREKLGKGGAIKNAFIHAKGGIVIFADADLSTDILHTGDLIDKIKCGSDICIGARLLPASKVRRSLTRTISSFIYTLLVRLLFNTRITDFQCGFKAFREKTCLPLISGIERTGFFWDTEFLLKAEKSGLKIFQMPVVWTENKESKIRLVRDSLYFLYHLIRLRLSIH